VHVVDAIEATQVLADGMFGRLDRERVAGASSVACERSDPAVGVGASDIRRFVRLHPPEVQTVGERNDVAREAIATYVRALPCRVRECRPQRRRERPPALGAARVPAPVGADHEQWLGATILAEGAALPRIDGGGVLDPIEGRRAVPCVAGVDGDAPDPIVVGRGRPADPADQQDPRAGSGLEGAEVPSDALRQAGVEEPVATPRPRVLEQQPVPDRRRRARERLLGRQAAQRAAIVARGHVRLSDRRGS
jgi:hypothetical protein